MATDTNPTNLPLQLTSFIGREPEIAEVKRLLGTTHLLTLTGSGGCGKTRLALQVAEGLRQEYPDGVRLIDFARLSDPLLVPQTVASTFDLHESAEAPITEILKNYLRAKNILLVLDNCEHLIQACAQLCNELLHFSPDLKILATSREAMNISGETAFRVPSLSLPDPQQLPSIKSYSEYESIRLFVERAQAARPEFELLDTNALAIAQICQRLDGMPLAIELAAARVNSIPIGEIATRLDDRFRLLTSGSRTALPRYQTLIASIDWSYNLLSNAERVLLRRLAVFAGGFTLDAVEGICIKEDKNEILDLLSQLVQKSLVVARLDDQPSYRLLETIRQYAQDKLSDSGEAEQVRTRHLEFFLRFAEEVRPRLRSAEQLKSLNRRRWEYENLRVAIEWACKDSRISNSRETGLRVINALDQLGDVYELLGIGTEAITFYRKAIALCDGLAVADKIIALRLHGKILQSISSLVWAIDVERFDAITKIGAASRTILELEKLESQEPHAEKVRLLTILSRDAWKIRTPPDWDAAERHARAAVDMAEKLDIPTELSVALVALTSIYSARDLLRERVQIALRRLALSREPHFSDVRERVNVLIETGYALVTVGEYIQAMPYLTEATNLADSILAVDQQLLVFQHRAYCFFRLDRWDEMLKIVDQVRDIRTRHPREYVGPECFPIALAASVHTRHGESDLGAAEREEAHSIMTAIAGPLERFARAQLY